MGSYTYFGIPHWKWLLKVVPLNVILQTWFSKRFLLQDHNIVFWRSGAKSAWDKLRFESKDRRSGSKTVEKEDSRKSGGIQESVAKTYGFRKWYCYMCCKLSIPGKFQGKNIRSLQPLHSQKCHRSKSYDCLVELEERFKFLIIKEENLDVKLW